MLLAECSQKPWSKRRTVKRYRLLRDYLLSTGVYDVSTRQRIEERDEDEEMPELKATTRLVTDWHHRCVRRSVLSSCCVGSALNQAAIGSVSILI